MSDELKQNQHSKFSTQHSLSPPASHSEFSTHNSAFASGAPSKFSEAQLEAAIIELLGEERYPHVLGETIERQAQEVLIKADEAVTAAANGK